MIPSIVLRGQQLYPTVAKETRMKRFKVGVFDDPIHLNRKPNAYTLWYNPEWFGCCQHYVEAVNGTQAKKLAIQEHIDICRANVHNGT